jgi:hypothetical protein
VTERERRRLLERLERRTEKESGDGCWLWSGYCRRGYGRVRVAGKTLSVHRVAHELLIGPIDAGADVDHDCHNRDSTCPGGVDCPHRRCWRPDHLRAATRSENVRAARTRGIVEVPPARPEEDEAGLWGVESEERDATAPGVRDEPMLGETRATRLHRVRARRRSRAAEGEPA